MNSRREGVIQFHLEYRPAPPPPVSSSLQAWRRLLHRLALVGQDPSRYGGYGFGNVSERLGAGFVVSGSQTGGPELLGADGYCHVRLADVDANRVVAEGPVRPSSESLTHAAVYALHSDVGAVLHIHSPELWQAAKALGLAMTDPAVHYGTPEMAREVYRLHRNEAWTDQGLFAMGGHVDGVVAFGPDPASAGKRLMGSLASALARTAAAGANSDNGPAGPCSGTP